MVSSPYERVPSTACPSARWALSTTWATGLSGPQPATLAPRIGRKIHTACKRERARPAHRSGHPAGKGFEPPHLRPDDLRAGGRDAHDPDQNGPVEEPHRATQVGDIGPGEHDSVQHPDHHERDHADGPRAHRRGLRRRTGEQVGQRDEEHRNVELGVDAVQHRRADERAGHHEAPARLDRRSGGEERERGQQRQRDERLGVRRAGHEQEWQRDAEGDHDGGDDNGAPHQLREQDVAGEQDKCADDGAGGQHRTSTGGREHHGHGDSRAMRELWLDLGRPDRVHGRSVVGHPDGDVRSRPSAHGTD